MGWIPKGEENPEIDMSMHGGSLRIPLGIKICGKEGSGTGQTEKLSCDAVPVKVEANLTGTSGAEITFQNCPKRGLRAGP